MLTYLQLKNDLYRMIGVTTSTVRTDMQTAVQQAILQAQQYFCLWGDWSFLHQYNDVIYIAIGIPYSTGHATATQDSKAIAGDSTVWTSDMVGRYFQFANSEFYEIQSFTSTTALTLAIPFQGTTVSTASDYYIWRRYYDLPLDFLRPLGRQARMTQANYGSEWIIDYNDDAGVRELQTQGRPTQFAIYGNRRRADYYNASTVTVATSSGTSTWTTASGTLPTDIVDREIRIDGEDKGYRIATRATANTLTTYEAYVSPSDGTGTQATASNYAITPKETMQLAINPVPLSDRYIMWLPYIKKLPQLLADADVSLISQAGYDEALLSCCRAQLALDGRTAQRADQVKALIPAREDAMARAWSAEQIFNNDKLQAEGQKSIRRKAYPSWIGQ